MEGLDVEDILHELLEVGPILLAAFGSGSAASGDAWVDTRHLLLLADVPGPLGSLSEVACDGPLVLSLEDDLLPSLDDHVQLSIYMGEVGEHPLALSSEALGLDGISDFRRLVKDLAYLHHLVDHEHVESAIVEHLEFDVLWDLLVNHNLIIRFERVRRHVELFAVHGLPCELLAVVEVDLNRASLGDVPLLLLFLVVSQGRDNDTVRLGLLQDMAVWIHDLLLTFSEDLVQRSFSSGYFQIRVI